MISFYIPSIIPRQSFQIDAGLRLLIQGTKNAYTTLLPWDVVLYIQNQQKTVGFLTINNTIQQLGVLEKDDAEYLPDLNTPPQPAQKLIDAKQLLRIISADRSKGIFTIDEYLGDDVYIPIIKPVEPPSSTLTRASLDSLPLTTTQAPIASTSTQIISPLNTNTNTNITPSSYSSQYALSEEDGDLNIVEAKLKIAQLELQRLRLLKRTSVTAIHPPIEPSPLLLQASSPTPADLTSTSTITTPPTLPSTPLPTPSPTAIPIPTLSTSRTNIKVSTKPAYTRLLQSHGFLYISGLNGIDSETHTLPEGTKDDFMTAIQSTYTIETEVREIYKNLISILYENNSHPNHLISITAIVKDTEYISLIHKMYIVMFPIDSDNGVKPPALRFIESYYPLSGDASLEIDAVAAVKG